MINKKKLGVLTITMISVGGVFSIRALPMMSEYGLSIITYSLIAVILFFIPSALICAELATGWPKPGGLYTWVYEAHGKRLGFLAIWLEWVNTVVSFPAMLAFIIAIFAYIFYPPLLHDKLIIYLLILGLFWGATLLNLFNIRVSLLMSHIGTLIGVIFPVAIIILMAIYWLIIGQKAHISFSLPHLLPHLHWHNIAFLSGIILGYAGMQVAAFHAQDIDQPRSTYPKAIALAAMIILIAYLFGSLAIAMVVPHEKISLVAGLMQSITIFFATFHQQKLIPIIALFIFLGFIANLNIWLISPIRGLFVCAKHNNLPHYLQKTNQHGAPCNLLISQAVITSLLSLVFLWMPNMSSSFWLLTALTAQLTFIMDILLFTAVIKLRYSQPNTKRNYKIPGGKVVIWLIAGGASLVCLIAFIIGFFPPSAWLKIGNPIFYDAFLTIGIVIFMSPAFFIR